MFPRVSAGLRMTLAAVVSLLLMTVLFLFSRPARDGAVLGLMLSGQVLIPSLFVFLCISEFIIRSGVSAMLGRLLSPVCRFLFYLPGACAPGILMSYLGGYPVGARSAAVLYERGEISREDARRMLLFTVNAGPAFVVFAVGDVLLGSRVLGILLLTSHLLPSLLMGILTGLYGRLKSPRRQPESRKAEPVSPADLAESFVSAVSAAGGVMLSICAFVVFFSALSGVLSALPLSPAITETLPPFLEITSGLGWAVESGSPVFLAAAISFGGLCVQFQVMTAAGEVFPNALWFFCARVVHALSSAGIMALLLRIFPVAAPVFSNRQTVRMALPAVSVPASAALLIMCLIFLWDCAELRREREKSKSLR